ncbi:PilZ domain-containing protein [Sphingomonas montana]|uniref:PilZ domain-containing protein n=1 Tax=Sphingomonas montana TaxID=1843236 RepID=UPI0013EC1641|nr:PilZ domain-containing protein [Sphingomonas montana]
MTSSNGTRQDATDASKVIEGGTSGEQDGQANLPPNLGPTQDAGTPPQAVALEPDERRSEPRFETTVTGRVRLPASEHECQIADISTTGMNVFAPDAMINVGLQVAVMSQGLPLLVGIVRWFNGGSFGVQFNKPISADIIERVSQLKRRVRSPRASRVKADFSAQVFFDSKIFPIIVRNISIGGLMMTTEPSFIRGKRKPIQIGQPLMIHIPDLFPFGGHVRWSCGSQYGVMFSKFLPSSVAHDISRIGNLNPAWIDDVRLTHMELGASR